MVAHGALQGCGWRRIDQGGGEVLLLYCRQANGSGVLQAGQRGIDGSPDCGWLLAPEHDAAYAGCA